MKMLSMSALLALGSGLVTNASVERGIPSLDPGPKRFKACGPKHRKSQVKLLGLIRICPGGAHGIFRSDVGEIRKPFDAETITWEPEQRP